MRGTKREKWLTPYADRPQLDREAAKVELLTEIAGRMQNIEQLLTALVQREQPRP